MTYFLSLTFERCLIFLHLASSAVCVFMKLILVLLLYYSLITCALLFYCGLKSFKCANVLWWGWKTVGTSLPACVAIVCSLLESCAPVHLSHSCHIPPPAVYDSGWSQDKNTRQVCRKNCLDPYTINTFQRSLSFQLTSEDIGLCNCIKCCRLGQLASWCIRQHLSDGVFLRLWVESLKG